jgi:hypothetical protein
MTQSISTDAEVKRIRVGVIEAAPIGGLDGRFCPFRVGISRAPSCTARALNASGLDIKHFRDCGHIGAMGVLARDW